MPKSAGQPAFGELFAIFIKLEIVSAKSYSLEKSKICCLGKGYTLPKDKSLALPKVKACVEDKVNVTQKIFVEHCGKRRKCWLPTFSPFPTILSEAIS